MADTPNTLQGQSTINCRMMVVDESGQWVPLKTKEDGLNMNVPPISDGDKGDITVSDEGTVWTIDNDAITTAKIADDAVTGAKIADNTITNANLQQNVIEFNNLTTAATNALFRKNLLINPEFAIAQRLPTGSAAVTDNTYYIDRWRNLTNGANTSNVSRIASGAIHSAQIDPSRQILSVTVGSSANQKFGVFQVLESYDVWHTKNAQLTFSAYLRVGSSNLSDIRMAIVEFQGTENATTGDPISSWNSAGTNPSLAAGWVYLNTPVSLSLAVATWTRCTVTGTPSGSMVNLGVLIWSDSTSNSTGDSLIISSVQLEQSASVTKFERRHIQQELALCQRYYEKSFNVDVTPVQNSGTSVGALGYRIQIGSTTAGWLQSCQFKEKKRTTPSITYYNPNAANTNWRNVSKPADSGASATQNLGETGFSCNNAQVAGDLVQESCAIHWSADAEL